jgi:DNA-binding LytR/AlgR family response regulator
MRRSGEALGNVRTMTGPAPALDALENAPQGALCTLPLGGPVDRYVEQSAKVLPEPQKEMVRPHRIALKTEGKTVLVDLAIVSVIEARGNQVLLQTPSRSYLLRESVSAVANKLERYGFVRIHRSTIVNASRVEEIRSSSSGEMLLRVKGAEKDYCVSRKYRNALKLLATCWI